MLVLPVRNQSIYVRTGDSDFDTVRQVFRNQDYAWVIRLRSLSAALLRYEAILASGRRPVIIDAGANIGAASLWFNQQYPEGTVVAIEPDPENVVLLKRNAQGRDIVVWDAAIRSEDGFVAVHNEGALWGVQTTRSDTGLSIVTVEQALAAMPIGELFIVKVDIEGLKAISLHREQGGAEALLMIARTIFWLGSPASTREHSNHTKL